MSAAVEPSPCTARGLQFGYEATTTMVPADQHHLNAPATASNSLLHKRTDWKAFYGNQLPEVIVISDDDDAEDDDTEDAQEVADGDEDDYHENVDVDDNHDNDFYVTGHHYLSGPQDTRKRGLTHGSDSSSRLYGSSEYSMERSSVSSVSSLSVFSESLLHDHLNPMPFEPLRPTSKRRRLDSQVKYSPPRKPIMKAEDVRVKRIFDTSSSPGRALASSNTPWDDKDGHYIVKSNHMFANRYRISELLGQGTFGKVVSAYDVETDRNVAIKIIRAIPKYRDASRIELRVLRTLSMYDRRNKNKCIHLRECFDYLNHICIVTDLLGCSIYDFMKNNDFAPFPGHQVQHLGAQLLRSVMFLHDLNLIHTDLKPENVLLVDSNSATKPYRSTWKKLKSMGPVRSVLNDTNIHLIDFGSAIFNDEYHSSVVSTRHYRAPEIILGIGWSFPCDIWSIGCILVELCTGDALFQTHENLEHLAFMEKIIGKTLPRSMLRRALNDVNGCKYVNAQGTGICYPSPSTDKVSLNDVNSSKTFEQKLRLAQSREAMLTNTSVTATDEFWDQFIDLVSRMLVYDPAKRITARQALAHPWFRTNLEYSKNTHAQPPAV